MVATSTLIIVVGGLLAIGGALAKLMWKAIVIVGLLIAGFGLANLIFGWIK